MHLADPLSQQVRRGQRRADEAPGLLRDLAPRELQERDGRTRVRARRLARCLRVMEEPLHRRPHRLPQVALVRHERLDHGQRGRRTDPPRDLERAEHTRHPGEAVIGQEGAHLQVRVGALLEHAVQLQHETVTERRRAVGHAQAPAHGRGPQDLAGAVTIGQPVLTVTDDLAQRARDAPASRHDAQQRLEDERHLAAVEEVLGMSPASESRDGACRRSLAEDRPAAPGPSSAARHT